jgi:hypothetical protein
MNPSWLLSDSVDLPFLSRLARIAVPSAAATHMATKTVAAMISRLAVLNQFWSQSIFHLRHCE